MPVAAMAIPAAISAGSSIFGGIMGSRAANSAANTQYQAALQQAQAFRDMLAQYNPAIGTTAAQAASDVNAAANTAGANLTNVAGNAAQGIAGAAGNANAFLNPFMTAGTGAATTLADLMSPGGALMKNFTLQDMQQNDPGYQFRIDTANKMAQQSAAARGGALGGGALQGLAQLNQNLASSEMQNAFSRFQTQQQNRFSNLYNMAGMGMNAGNLMGQNLMGAAQIGGNWLNNAAQTAGGWGLQGSEFGGNLQAQAAQQMANNAITTQRSIADLMTGGANAQAAGTMGAANAWSGMLGGLANTAGQVGGYYQSKNLLGMLGPNSAPTPYQVNNLPMGTGPGVQGNPWAFTPIGAPPILPQSTPQYAGPYMPEYMNPGYFGPYGGYPTK